MTNNYLYFCGKLFPEPLLKQHFDKLAKQISLSGNTFYSSILSGFIKNDYKVYATSFIEKNIYKNIENNFDVHFWFHKSWRNRFIKYISVFKNVLSDILRFYKISKNNNRIIVFNILKHSYSVPGLLICKILRIKTIAIVTDVPGYRTSSSTNNALNKFGDFIGRHLLNHFDFYVLLSENMANVIKKKELQYVVVEGIYKETELPSKISLNIIDSNSYFNILYAGSLDKEYGILNLLSAFLNINDPNIRLIICGLGDSSDEIYKMSQNDYRIIFAGRVPHEIVIELERRASLLVNPRPIDDEFVKYSFPSKLMEYLASGTPTLATNIPSLPKEYKQYINLMEDNKIDTITESIKKILYSKNSTEFLDKASKARLFVLNEKNEFKQVEKIIKAYTNFTHDPIR